MDNSRYAIYYVPAAGSPLARFGASVLGYDCDAGTCIERRPLPGIATDEQTRVALEPARYGFHATLKAPFTLRAEYAAEDLARRLAALASKRRTVHIGRLAVLELGAFIAVRPATARTSMILLPPA